MTARKPIVLVGNVSGEILNTDVLAAAVGNGPVNLSLAASVAGSALTVALKGADGNDPSPANPVLIPFRNPTLATGDPKWLAVTAAVAFTVGSGNTMGSANGTPLRLWVVGIDNGGTSLLGLVNCSDGATTIYPLSESALQSTGPGTGGANAAGTIYTTVASLSGVPIVILGYLEFSAGQATAGTWATPPSAVRLHSTGAKKPGDIVQRKRFKSTTANNNNTNAYNNSQGISGIITPTSACNAVAARVSGGIFCNPGWNTMASIRLARQVNGALANGSAGLCETGIYLFINGVTPGSNSALQTGVALEDLDFPATTQYVTYGTQIRTSDNASNAIYPNAGMVNMVLEEIMA